MMNTYVNVGSYQNSQDLVITPPILDDISYDRCPPLGHELQEGPRRLLYHIKSIHIFLYIKQVCVFSRTNIYQFLSYAGIYASIN